MKALILAAGFGKRMLPLTKFTPKPIIKVNHKLLIENSIINLQTSGISEIIINLHHLGNKIKNVLGDGSKWKINITYSEEKKLLDTGGAIVNAINNKLLGNEPFIVTSADLITDFDFRLLNLKSNKLAHLLLVPNPTFNPKGDFGINNGQLNFINPEQPNEPTFTYANIGIFNPKLFSGSVADTIPLISFINKGIKAQQITAEVYYGLWKNVGSLKELEEVNSWQI